MKIKKSSTQGTPNELRTLFAYSSIGAFAITVFVDIARAMSQLSSNPNLSGFYITFLSLSLLPLVVFSLAYLLHGRVKNVSTKIFDSLVFTASILALNIAFNTILYALFSGLKFASGDFFGSFGQQLIVAGTLVVLSVLYLIQLKKAKRW